MGATMAQNLAHETAREIGRTYAARGPWIDDVTPGDPADEALFESRPIPADAWSAFETSALCEHMHGIPHEGIIGAYEEFWFTAPQLPALIALLETELGHAPHQARAWLSELARFARRAQARNVGVTFVVSG
ncbi:hypothetical protein [Pseudorhodoplanes sinuspersici]|uniref:Uncharacterized protein n=1 Tax=Pseudorhodoplanes sinuspersici TaxID=1235591 RepID=A0A1W6ZXP4_9HYPH|nr:hypothetical protein [Pseudorhodoplanes sinuspersici]ARQ02086.1 hypothetical protein CAK95_25540 [Pseudorhodoplanes sinuspersici]RKE73883.1 hypothetical protein DFP91_1780 [Pseudorhodoplanes sinuspersici]